MFLQPLLQGWAWSFVTHAELPYLCDLQLFFARPLTSTITDNSDQTFTQNLVLGTFEREKIGEDMEYLRSLDNVNHSLPTLRDVMKRGHIMYERSKGKASLQSYKRAKEMTKDSNWQLAGSDTGMHPVLLRGSNAAEKRRLEDAKKVLLRAVNAFTPSETVLEVGNKTGSVNVALMKQRREALQKSVARAINPSYSVHDEDEDEKMGTANELEMADEEDVAVRKVILIKFSSETFLQAVFNIQKRKNFRDEEFYMSHFQRDASTEKG